MDEWLYGLIAALSRPAFHFHSSAHGFCLRFDQVQAQPLALGMGMKAFVEAKQLVPVLLEVNAQPVVGENEQNEVFLPPGFQPYFQGRSGERYFEALDSRLNRMLCT